MTLEWFRNMHLLTVRIILAELLKGMKWKAIDNYECIHNYVKSHFTVSSYKSEMKGIYTSCVCKETLDEAPFAYRAIDEIVEVIGDTVQIDKAIRAIYNYKDKGEKN